MLTHSVASTNASTNQQDYSSMAKKMKKIQLLLSSLKQDQEDQMIHLQTLISKGQEVEDRAKIKINQCQELKDFVRSPTNKDGVLFQNSQFSKNQSKGHSLQTRIKQNNVEQIQYMRLKTSISPDFHNRFKRTDKHQQNKVHKLKTFQQLKKQNRLQQLAEMVHTSLKDIKPKQLKQLNKNIKPQNSINSIKPQRQRKLSGSNNHSRVLSRIKQNKMSQNQIQQTKQSKGISSKLIIIFLLGLISCLITYY